MSGRCVNCVFYRKHPDYPTDNGRCFRFPPQVVGGYEKDRGGYAELVTASVWPEVGEMDTCGAFAQIVQVAWLATREEDVWAEEVA